MLRGATCQPREKNGDPGAIRTRDPQLRRLFWKSRNLLILQGYSETLVRSRSAMRCQEVPWGDTSTSTRGRSNAARAETWRRTHSWSLPSRAQPVSISDVSGRNFGRALGAGRTVTWASDGAAGREGFVGQPRGSVEGSPACSESVYEISGYRDPTGPSVPKSTSCSRTQRAARSVQLGLYP